VTPYRERTESEMLQDGIQRARQSAYDAVCPPMSRAERRSAKGRMLIAQAELAAMKAENDFLREELGLREKPVEIVAVSAEPLKTEVVFKQRDWQAINDEFQRVPHDDSRNWVEDYPHDNGQYMNLCRTCERLFMGYKRRCQCRDCAHPQPPTEGATL
jgi:hypothetical protein